MKALRHAIAFVALGFVYGLGGFGLGQAVWARLSAQVQQAIAPFGCGLAAAAGIGLLLCLSWLVVLFIAFERHQQRFRAREADFTSAGWPDADGETNDDLRAEQLKSILNRL